MKKKKVLHAEYVSVYPQLFICHLKIVHLWQLILFYGVKY